MNSCTADETIPLTTHLIIECSFSKTFARNAFQWFNATNACQIIPTTTEEISFSVTSNSSDKRITRKLNYTALFMRYYLYSSKLHNKSISLQDFTAKLQKSTVLRILAEPCKYINGNYYPPFGLLFLLLSNNILCIVKSPGQNMIIKRIINRKKIYFKLRIFASKMATLSPNSWRPPVFLGFYWLLCALFLILVFLKGLCDAILISFQTLYSHQLHSKNNGLVLLIKTILRH